MVEKEEVKIESFKASFTSTQQRPIQNENSSKSLLKVMANLKLKYVEIENMKGNTQITNLKVTLAQKEHDVKESDEGKIVQVQ